MSDTPGEVLVLMLAHREWTQGAFAEILVRPLQFVNEVISGRKEITRRSACQIGAALETSPEYWLELQHDYRMGLLWQDEQFQERLHGIRIRREVRDSSR